LIGVPRGSVLLVAGALAVAADAGDSPVHVRVLYVLPQTPSLDVYMNAEPGLEEPTFQSVMFGAPTEYMAFPPGDYAIRATPSGQPAPLVLDTGAGFAPSSVQSFLVLGFYPALQGLPVVENPAVTVGAARLRFLHAAQGEPSLDLYLADGPPVASGVRFSESGGPVDVAPGKYDLEVTPAGRGAPLKVIVGVSLEAGHLYTAFIVGSTALGMTTGFVALDNVLEPDVTGDGSVDVDDLVQVILDWGPCVSGPGSCSADADDDGVSDVADLEAVIVHFE
jgi:hypothetical protein